eukprot:TRINITY_DN13598_c0_g1_i1.p1 TRINITY_DN13598_c0_g1~~TRINITY_DN13598_c0_g1_i1.p1  ORF type:complete len:1425 (+),score=288.78 TRINITY_DN13598_c0_g1_i1:78-4352(+)
MVEALDRLVRLGFSRDQAVAALRARGGDQDAAANFLLKGRPDPSSIEALMNFGFSYGQAVAALKVSSNVELAAGWILDHPEAGNDVTETEALPNDDAPSEAETIAKISEYTQDAALTAGHDFEDAEEDALCILCRLDKSDVLAGTLRCRNCYLCQGCCASSVADRCPALANGGVLHQHALLYRRSDSVRCTVRGENCLGHRTAWICSEASCSFAACAVCIARPAPLGWRRHGRKGAGKGKGKRAARDGAEEEENSADRVPEFNAALAERIAAQGWESRAVAQEGAQAQVEAGGEDSDVVLGSGAIRPASETHSSASSSLPPPRQHVLMLDRNLSAPSARALAGFQGHGSPALRAARAAAAGKAGDDGQDVQTIAAVTAAEEFLVHGEVVGLTRAEHDQLKAAVAAGELGLAGQIIMGASLSDASLPPGTVDASSAESAMCPVCAEEIRGAEQLGGVVGCLKGHAIHAACAADLTLGGGACPTCRSPLYYAQVSKAEAEAARCIASAEAEQRVQSEGDDEQDRSPGQFHVGDTVRILANASECEKLQSAPEVGGWSPDMASACDAEGEVVEIIGTRSSSGEAVFAVEVCTDNLDIWRWHSQLLTLVCSYCKGQPDKERRAAKKSAEQLARLRAELAAVKKARTQVGVESTSVLMRASAAEGGIEQHSIAPLALERHLTGGSMLAVAKLGSDVAPVDVQRARHLLALARGWGDSTEGKEAREQLYAAVSAGDIDSVARTVRHHNAMEQMQHALWTDAVRESSDYRVAPGVRIELLVRPRRGAPRTGYALSPGMEFTSTKEVVDEDGNLWLRIGDPRSIAAKVLESYSVKDTSTGGEEGDAPRKFPVREEDFPHAISARVARGPDWQDGDEDGGEGCQGTLLGKYNAARGGWARVRWDAGRQAEHYHRVGAEGSYDLVYVGSPPLPPPAAHGWMQVRPGGPGTSAIVANVRGALRCFDCGGELALPSAFGSGNVRCRREAFTPVNADLVKAGDAVLVAATFERAFVVEVLKPQLNGEDSKPGAKQVGSDCALVLCRFPELGAEAEACDVDAVFRAKDLVWPAIEGAAGHSEEFRLYQDALRSRRELVLMLGSEKAARDCWQQASGSNSSGVTFASCVRGHLLHARCFQGRLLGGRCCPVCPEPLFVPRVQRTRQDEQDCCGARSDHAAAEALETVQATEAIAQQAGAVESDANAEVAPGEVTSMRGGMVQTKMCPVCCSGPLLNENCSDLRAHHGQCPRCNERPHTAASIAEALARGTASVGDRIPRCGNCNVAVIFNGCLECGHLFVDTDWEDLPAWDAAAKGCLAVSIRHRRAARLLAEQVRHEAALLAHERAALEEAQSGESPRPPVRIEPPPPPVSLPPRCGPHCNRRHRGLCLVCEHPWSRHSGHECPDGSRGSWLLLPGSIVEEGDSDYREFDQYDEEEEE